ncbi:hypothetical protein [Mesonia aquimarina]|uniref:hypothetical protein n=1 Tax=Mesonia aquimarina TaxID=1504967 RepID=UPI0013CED753|nr:hypothetical protein [Mesonia aquimarina]
MINKKEIVLDQLKESLEQAFILGLSYLLINEYDFYGSFIFGLIVLVFLVGFSLIMSENYLVEFEIKNGKIFFDYKITLSEPLHKQEIDIDSIRTLKFHSKSTVLKDFHSLSIKYSKGNNLEKFNIKVKDDKTWITVLNELNNCHK